MIQDRIHALIGTAGTAATFTLATFNEMLGTLAGLLTVAYLLRQHLAFNRRKK
jgi:hypothetical protein